ncbi:MAG: ATP-binding protein [Lachnospiraceae bacterium]|nr:ATP-binding protein [Lachnospiraceae bacterium]
MNEIDHSGQKRPRTVAIGVQDFDKLISKNYFYIDKTAFIKEWWDSGDEVTLITRPRRFGKTLNMSMLDRFFSNKYEGQGEVFENLNIWKEEEYRKLQGTFPVLFLSFAGIKETDYVSAQQAICQVITKLYVEFDYLRTSDVMTEIDQNYWKTVSADMNKVNAAMALHNLCDYLHRYYGKKVIVLLDEYDTPLQEAYVNGYWKELVSFTRSLFNNTFKTNFHLERAVMTGITRVSKESMFSDLNNLNVVTMVSSEYASYFGFTESEVFFAMDEFGLKNKDEVKFWYDGFTVGDQKDIYNPWSIISFLNKRQLRSYWANTSSNSLVGSLIRTGDIEIKMQFEDLLRGYTIHSDIDDEMVFNQLDDHDASAVWSLLFASGYLKAVEIQGDIYELELTNYEVRGMFESMVKGWLRKDRTHYNRFVKAMLQDDLESMNEYMNRFALSTISYFDVGNKPSDQAEPERFYHGFVLGLLVDLRDRYEIISNQESGFGRYDIMLKPLNETDDGIILEFKVWNPRKEDTLEETVQSALMQIEQKQYEQALLNQGISKERIRKYGFGFRGKEVLIG